MSSSTFEEQSDWGSMVLQPKSRELCIANGRRYLLSNAHQFHSQASDGKTMIEVFSKLWILQILGPEHRFLVDIEDHDGPYNFFEGEIPVNTSSSFPPDLDTTSMALLTLSLDGGNVQSVLDQMLEYVNDEGIIQVYFDPTRPRVDRNVCLNILRCFQRFGRRHELVGTWNYVVQVLKDHAFLGTSRHYYCPDTFLFLFASLLHDAPSSKSGPVPKQAQLENYVKMALMARIGASPSPEKINERVHILPGDKVDPAGLAQRVLGCQLMGLESLIDLESLMRLQEDDGGWGPGDIYRYGKTGITVGNRGYTTSMALKALELIHQSAQPED